MKFTKDDLKPGMAVKLRNGRYCLAVPTAGALAFVRCQEDNTLYVETDDAILTNDLDHGAESPHGWDIMEVYGLSHRGGLIFCEGDDGRALIWKRAPEAKKMTISQIEEALGYPIEIIKEEK